MKTLTYFMVSLLPLSSLYFPNNELLADAVNIVIENAVENEDMNWEENSDETFSRVSKKKSTTASSNSKNKQKIVAKANRIVADDSEDDADEALDNAPSHNPPSAVQEKELPFYHYNGYLKTRQGGGVGYPDGYSSLTGLLGFRLAPRQVFLLDLRGHIFNDGKLAANAGVVYRIRPWEGKSYTFGANTYFDARSTSRKTYYQVGVGFEFLNKYLDFRTNGYIPCVKTEGFRGFHDPKFQGYNLLLTETQKRSLYGFDAEVGRNAYCNHFFDLYAAVGSYYYQHGNLNTGAGVRGRLKTSFFQRISLEGDITYDRLFKTKVQGVVALNYAIPSKSMRKRIKDPHHCTMPDLYQEPLRNEIIVQKNHHHQVVATGPDGQPLQFLHINNSFLGAGNGTIEAPFTTFAAAEAIAGSNAIYYVDPGSSASSPYAATNFTLNGNQDVMGSGMAQTIHVSNRGGTSIVVPALYATRPVITGNFLLSSGANSEVSGITLTSTGVQSFRGASASASDNPSLYLHDSTITSSTGIMGTGGATDSVFDVVNINNTVMTGSGDMLIPFVNQFILTNSTVTTTGGFAIVGPSVGTGSFTQVIITNNHIIETTSASIAINIEKQVGFGTVLDNLQISNNTISGSYGSFPSAVVSLDALSYGFAQITNNDFRHAVTTGAPAPAFIDVSGVPVPTAGIIEGNIFAPAAAVGPNIKGTNIPIGINIISP